MTGEVLKEGLFPKLVKVLFRMHESADIHQLLRSQESHKESRTCG